MKRKIIGYKLREDSKQYESAAAKICGYSKGKLDSVSSEMDFYDDSDDKNALSKAKVLTLWFEPIYEEEKVDLKVGDWIYILKIKTYESFEGNVVRIDKIYPDLFRGMWIDHTPTSFSGGGFRWDDNAYQVNRDFRLATTKEVDDYLFEEAKRRYPIGTVIKPVHLGANSPTTTTVISHLPYGSEEDHYVGFSDKGLDWIPCVYDKYTNTWAEIVKETTPKITINGYDAVFTKDTVSFGCQTLTYEMVEKLVDLDAHHITLVDVDGDSISEQVHEIHGYLSKTKN